MGPPPQLDMHALTLYHERLRVMVTALLGDEHGAEDAVQEVWMRALGKGPRDPQALGAWLWTTARRVVSNRRRGDLRRRLRESQVAGEQTQVSSEELAQRIELQHQVSGVLQGLAEPHRSLLREHYFAGKTSVELAVTYGVGLATLKTRLRLARAHMRRALEREGFGRQDSSHWSWIAFALPKSQTPVLLGGLIAMKKVVGIAVAVALASALLLWKSPWQGAAEGPGPLALAPKEEPTLASPAGDGVEPVLQAPETLQPELRSAPGNQPRPAAARNWVVRGQARLMDGAEGELPSVGLRLVLEAGTGEGGEILDRTEVKTGPDGLFAWALADPGQAVSVTASLDEVQGFRANVQERSIAFPGEGAPQGIIVRLWPRDAWVEGVVRASAVDAAPGDPIAGALVRFNEAETHTDENGAYRLAVPSRGYGSVIVSAVGFRQGGLTPGKLVARETTRIDVELDPELGPEGRLFGYVRDSQGVVVPGALVSCNVSREKQVSSDATGYYELNGVEWEPGIHIACRADHASFASNEVLLGMPSGSAAPAEGTQQDFVLVPGSRLEGRVTDSLGDPVQGARIWIGPDAMLVANRKAYSDRDGAFVFEHVAPGSTLLGARKRGHPEFVRRLEVPANGELLRVDVVFERGVALTGRVVDASGEAVVGATLLARRASDNALQDGLGQGSAGRSDGEGRFRIDGATAGALNIRIRGEGIVWTDLRHEHDGSDVELVVRRASGIGGQVVDSSTGQPIEAFRVLLIHHEDDALGPWVSGIDISWVMGGVAFGSPDGRWSNSSKDLFAGGSWTKVQIEAAGYQTLTTEPLQVGPPGQPSDWLFELKPK